MNNNALIGYTGFVGSNILSQSEFEYKYNSKNINNISNKSFDLVICAGVNAKKWWANENPVEDKSKIQDLIKYLKTITCNKFILISSIDVYKEPFNVDENSHINVNELDAYGKNRYFLEEFIKSNFSNSLIIRLPAIYGKGLKKNFIYDLMNPIPPIIKNNKYNELKLMLNSTDIELLNSLYKIDYYGDYYLNCNDKYKKDLLLEVFAPINFTSMNFTDSSSIFQFYNLDNLLKDVNIAIKNDITLLNMSSEPIRASEIALRCFNVEFKNTIKNKIPSNYNFKSAHYELFSGENGYLYNKESVFKEIENFATLGKIL